MNEQSYEEYIRSILGYPSASANMNNYANNSYNNMEGNMFSNQNSNNQLLEECYPEIYKIVYPMVVKSCRNNTKPLTRELIEDMTDEIYMAVENDHNEIGINITLNNEVKTSNTTNTANTINTTNNRAMQNRNTNYSPSQNARKEINKEIAEPKKEVENRGEDRQFRNRNLRDLIQILLIRELLGRPGGPAMRPPMPPPQRPPFQGGGYNPRPGFGPRPPIMPRGPLNYEDIYE